MVVKVQVDSTGTKVLVYDRERKFRFEGDLEDELRYVLEDIRGEEFDHTNLPWKAYFHAEIEGDKFVLYKPANPHQVW